MQTLSSINPFEGALDSGLVLGTNIIYEEDECPYGFVKTNEKCVEIKCRYLSDVILELKNKKGKPKKSRVYQCIY